MNEAEPFDFEEREGALVIRVRGPLTMENTDSLRAQTLARLAKGGPLRGIVMDLRACDYLDSTGIGAFIVFKLRFKDINRFRLCAPTTVVRRIFKATRFELVVFIDEELDASLKALPADAVQP